ncbi:MAG TPA: tyrosine-type recombinase/integrase [Sphingobium sp.]|uniref:tyrosine-type recombinase/integrase n=1 Tax=Sphingobium sp. TaxID=1912891 RepID=UPI002ECFC9D8
MPELRALTAEAPPVLEVVAQVEALTRLRRLPDPQVVAAATRAWSRNTIRAFLSDLRLWDDWCRRRGLQTSEADADVVAAYLRGLAGIERDPRNIMKVRAAATIERYLVNIGWAYRMAGLEDPTAASLVRFELKALRKTLGTRQHQARGLRFKGEVVDLDDAPSGVCLAHLLMACRRDMLGARDRAFLLVAYDSGCRRSELVAVTCEAIEGPDADGAGTLFIGTSKTDQEGRGAFAYLSPTTMVAIAAWRKAGMILRGPLFRRVETYFDGSVRCVGEGALHPNSVTLIYRRLVRAAFAKKLLGTMGEIELERWVSAVSSHSIRVGVAQDNFAAGESLPAIMQAYRWRDPKTVMRYGARLAAKSGASARLAKRFGAQ